MSVGLIACNSDNNSDSIVVPETDFSYDFNVKNYDATAIFSDYPDGEETTYLLTSAYEALPENFSEIKGWKLSGNNHSDDLFMGIKIPIDGLLSATLYKATLTIEFVTNVSKNCMGIGGAPGESVYVKLAASKDEPVNELDAQMNRLTIDIGNQSQSGTEGTTVGNIANSIECGADPVYEKKTLSTSESIDVMTDNDGKVWLTAGFDSGFEGNTEIFITKLSANIVE